MNLRTMTRGASTLAITGLVLCLLAGTALAYWTTLGSGFGQASAGTLQAPTGVAANPISGSATSLRVNWIHPSGLAPTSYSVTAGSQGCSTSYPATTCDVTGLVANTGYSVVVSSLYKSAWSAPATAVTGTTNPNAPALTVTTPANGATGVAINTVISGGTNASSNVAVQLYLGSDTSTVAIGSLTGAVTGVTWTTPPATLLNNTTYTAVATQSTAGGSSTATTTFTTVAVVANPVTVSTPDLLAADDTGTSTTDNITKLASPRFSGTATPGATVTLMEGASARSAAAIADITGAWTATVNVTLTDGVHAISAAATHPGFTPATSSALSVTIDTLAPVVGTITVANNGTNSNNKVLSGTASTPTSHPGTLASVSVSVAGHASCSVTPTTAAVDASTGAWGGSGGPTVGLNNNRSCTATVSLGDTAGNTGSNTATVARG